MCNPRSVSLCNDCHYMKQKKFPSYFSQICVTFQESVQFNACFPVSNWHVPKMEHAQTMYNVIRNGKRVTEFYLFRSLRSVAEGTADRRRKADRSVRVSVDGRSVVQEGVRVCRGSEESACCKEDKPFREATKGASLDLFHKPI